MIFTLKGRIGIGIGISLGIIFFFYAAVYNPQVKLIKEIRREIAKENLNISQMKTSLKEYKELKEECEAMDVRLASLENWLIGEEEIFSFFRELGLRAKTYGIEYIEIVPEKVISGEYYDQIPVRIQLYSTYHTLGIFLSDVGKRQKMSSITVQNIEMKGIRKKEEKSPGEKNYTVETNFLISIYSKKHSSEKVVVKEGQSLASFLELEEEVGTGIQYQRVQERRR